MSSSANLSGMRVHDIAPVLYCVRIAPGKRRFASSRSTECVLESDEVIEDDEVMFANTTSALHSTLSDSSRACFRVAWAFDLMAYIR